jgi:hypothetical protein
MRLISERFGNVSNADGGNITSWRLTEMCAGGHRFASPNVRATWGGGGERRAPGRWAVALATLAASPGRHPHRRGLTRRPVDSNVAFYVSDQFKGRRAQGVPAIRRRGDRDGLPRRIGRSARRWFGAWPTRSTRR